jgi:squalene-hopene/tetraprenyl-beta-curcumene cyclase
MLNPASRLTVPHPLLPELSDVATHLRSSIEGRQEQDGHWHYALDDNMTMNAEFILFHRWIDLDDELLIRKLAHAMLNRQSADGSWPIYSQGPGHLSTTIEVYFALRAAGFSASDPRLINAKNFILSEGGIPKARVFTKIWLALFGLYPWDGVPVIPPEIMMAPKGLPFHLNEFSYWSRTTIVPLTILFHLQRTKDLGFDLDELYLHPEDKKKIDLIAPPPADESWFFSPNRIDLSWIQWEQVFIALNKGVGLYETKMPLKPLRAFCVRKARDWILERQEESGDWAGIQPPMINGIMALYALGMKLTDEPLKKGLEALHRFTRGHGKVIRAHAHERSDEAVLQSCVSPIWDTLLAALGLLETGSDPRSPEFQKTKDWLWSQRITRRGDWVGKSKLKKNQSFAAWCFQYHNTWNPDVDDSALVTLVLHRLGMSKEELKPALTWIFAMHGSDGGWGTFDRDNNQTILNRIPFADLKSLIDPSNPDVTGHVLELLGEMGLTQRPEVKSAIRYLKAVQRSDGSWFGRWGVNFLYGTSAAVVGLTKVGEPANAPYLQRSLRFFLSRQNADGGWGESCDSYTLPSTQAPHLSTPSQTAWALMALSCLLTPADADWAAVERGVRYLQSQKSEDGLKEDLSTGTGFPQHFYLRYDGYRNFFPLIALGRIQQRI